MLTKYVGKLPPEKLHRLERALKIGLELNNEFEERTIGLRLTEKASPILLLSEKLREADS
jgi:hypothetical protein